jgi:hypothetical protein
MRRPIVAATAIAALAGLFASGCATTASKPVAAKLPYRIEGKNTVIWEDEYQFEAPPESWKLVRVEGGNEFAFAFIKFGGCPFPCQSTFAYDEEPFGYATDLDKRMDEFYRRFLWATEIRFGNVQTRKVQVLGGEGLTGIAEGKDTVLGHKVWTQVTLGKRGDRVVAFYFIEWRRTNEAFNEQDKADFQRFVDSFRFLKKSFYQTL